jgi:uncharacterized protein YciI
MNEEKPKRTPMQEFGDFVVNGPKEKTYRIIRCHFKNGNEIIATGMSLEDAQEWCQRDDTHGDGWFDVYREE